jgi:hypothetical protein
VHDVIPQPTTAIGVVAASDVPASVDAGASAVPKEPHAATPITAAKLRPLRVRTPER